VAGPVDVRDPLPEEELRDVAAAADNRRQVLEDVRGMVARLEAAIGESDGESSTT
jgi:hypothetical protein